MRIEDNMLNKIAVLYAVHFGNKDPWLVTCKDCLDFKTALCPGIYLCSIRDVFDCMYYKAKNCEVVEG